MTLPTVRSADHAVLAAALEPGAVLCTLVGIDGAFSRRLGAQLVVAASGAISGSLSDGCLEAELARQAEGARAEVTRRVLRYGAGSPYIDFRLPCGAGVDVLVDAAPDRAALAAVLDRLGRRQPGVFAVPGAEAALTIEYVPRLRILALGAGPEVAALGRIAGAFGADCVPFVPAGGLAGDDRPETGAVDAWTAVAFLFHEHEWERRLLPWALGTEAFLVGAIGGTTTRAQRRAMLRAAGLGPEAIARVRSPFGLIPQARDPATLALAVLAEIVREYESLIERGP